jgi:hypothetical protein
MVNILGHPKPKVTWDHGDEEVVVDTGITIEGDGTFSRLSIKKMTSVKAGKYRIEATNEVGTDNAEFTVNVKGKCDVL